MAMELMVKGRKRLVLNDMVGNLLSANVQLVCLRNPLASQAKCCQWQSAKQ